MLVRAAIHVPRLACGGISVCGFSSLSKLKT